MSKKTLGVKLTAPFYHESKENAIYWALRSESPDLSKEFKGSDLVIDGNFEKKGNFIKSQKHIYKVIKTKNIKEAENIFIKFGERYGSVFGSASKDGKWLIIGNSLCYNLSQADAEEDAIRTMDWLQELKATQ